MEPTLAITLENKVKAVIECNISLKQKRLTDADIAYTIKVKDQYLQEIKALVEAHPELAHHPALLKIEADIALFTLDTSKAN